MANQIELCTVKAADWLKNKEQFVEQVGSSLHKTGFFALVDHDISQEELDQCYRQVQELFALQNLNDYIGKEGQRGYTPFGTEHAKDSQDKPDLKEFWHIGPEEAASGHQNFWPEELPQFKPTMLSIYNKLFGLADRCLRGCALYLKENEGLFADVTPHSDTILRAIHYPPTNSKADLLEQGSIRAAAHEDINLITMLVAATDSGLQLKSHDGEWFDIVYPPGAVVVDSGDMLQNMTNGFYRSTTHRVVNPEGQRADQPRYSMPFFVHPRKDTDLTPLESCCVQKPACYPSLTAGQFLDQRLKEIGLM